MRAVGRRRTSGCPAMSATSRSSSVVLYGIRWERARLGTRAAILASSRGRVQQLLAERARRRVVHRDEREPGSGVARDHAGQQGQVVLDDLGRDRHRRHVDHAQPGLTQQHQQEQEPFLHGLRHAAARRRSPVEGDRRDDHDRLVVVVETHRLPDLGHPRLQGVEPPVPFLLGQGRQHVGPRVGWRPQVAGHDDGPRVVDALDAERADAAAETLAARGCRRPRRPRATRRWRTPAR